MGSSKAFWQGVALFLGLGPLISNNTSDSGDSLHKTSDSPSYSDYVVTIRSSKGEDCVGLLFNTDIIITSQGCYQKDRSNPQNVLIKSYSAASRKKTTSPYEIIDEKSVPMISYERKGLPKLESYNIKFLKLHRPTPYPSRLVFPTRAFNPSSDHMKRIDWYVKNKASDGPKEDELYDLGDERCQKNGTNRIDPDYDFCGVDFGYVGCKSYRGSAVVVEKPNRVVFYGVDAPFNCVGDIETYSKLSPLVEEIKKSLR